MRSFDVPEVIEFQEVPLSDEVRMVPESPTETYDLVVVPEELELLDESSFFAQEMIVRLKQKISNMCKIFFIITLIKSIKRNFEIHIFIFAIKIS